MSVVMCLSHIFFPVTPQHIGGKLTSCLHCKTKVMEINSLMQRKLRYEKINGGTDAHKIRYLIMIGTFPKCLRNTQSHEQKYGIVSSHLTGSIDIPNETC